MAKNRQNKIAGVTYDTFLGPAKPRKGPKQKELNKYSNQLIAFLDILGITSLIRKHTDGDEYIAIDKIEEIQKIVETSINSVSKPKRIDYLHISDSFVFVCDPKSIILLIELLSTIQMRIISECSFLLRGAVTIGDAIVKDEAKFIVGPAYIQAYQLQENDAIYPRIIVDKSITREIIKSKNLIDKYLYQDSDKEFFIDYIKVYMQKESLGKQKIKFILRSENDIFNWLRKCFKENYKKEKHNISQKYGWTIQYFKRLGVWER